MYCSALFFLLASLVHSSSPREQHGLVSIPYEATYLLPSGFTGNPKKSFFSGTTTSNKTLNQLLHRASQSPFVSYSSEFTSLLPKNPVAKLVDSRSGKDFAYEAGVWVPTTNEVWFSSAVYQLPAYLSKLDLASGKVSRLNTDPSILNPNGGYFFDGKVYIATYPDNTTHRSSILAIDPKTRKATTVLNSYFGLEFNFFDDIVGVKCSGKRYLFFTDLTLAREEESYKSIPPTQFPAQVWRFDLDDNILLPVISSLDINQPNGIRVSPDMKTLYVTDTAIYRGKARQTNASPNVYAYDFNEHCMPVNRRVFALASPGFADGLHIDDKGRVWTGETDGIVVRNPEGKSLGVFNGQAFVAKGYPYAIANFALVEDMLVVLAGTRLWTVQLAETVVSKASPIVN